MQSAMARVVRPCERSKAILATSSRVPVGRPSRLPRLRAVSNPARVRAEILSLSCFATHAKIGMSSSPTGEVVSIMGSVKDLNLTPLLASCSRPKFHGVRTVFS